MKLVLIVLVIFLPLFLLRYNASQPKFSPGDRIKITAIISQEPLVFKNIQRLYVSNLAIFAPRFPEYHYGDRIEATGVVEKNERGFVLKKAEVTLTQKHGFLPGLRNKIIELIKSALPVREAALVAGITLGAKETLSRDFKDSLIKSGTLHVVVASGMNVTFLARFLIIILVVFLKRPFALPGAFIGTWIYVFLIGPDAPIVRAGVMGSLAFLAQESGKIYWAWWGLLFAGAAMLLLNPFWIADLGFLLSFTATASILAFEKPIRAYFSSKLRYFPGVFRDNFATSLAAQAGVLPILWFSFGQFTVWSPLVNALLLWTVAPIMTIGFLGGFIGLTLERAGHAILLLAYPLALYFTTIVSLFLF